MRKLLTFKSWHLFLLIVACGAWKIPGPLKDIFNGIAIVTFLLWIYAIGVYGQERIAELGLKTMNTNLFKFNVLFVGVFFLILRIFFDKVGITRVDKLELKDIPLIVAGLYLFFAMLHTLFFAGKTIAGIEYKKETTFGDYFPNLLLLVFFIAGVWVLQPKVNKFFATNEAILQ